MLKKLVFLAAPLLFALLSPVFAFGGPNKNSDELSDEVAALNNEAIACVNAHRYQAGIDLLEQAIALQPDFAMAHYNLGRIYELQNRFSPAINAFKHAVLLNPALAAAYHHLGISYNRIGRYAD